MKKRVIAVSALALASVAVLAGCRSHDAAGSGKAKTDLKAAIVTDTGGVNDRSFNQSAWEGLQSWGKENNLKKVQDTLISNLTLLQIIQLTITLRNNKATNFCLVSDSLYKMQHQLQQKIILNLTL